MQCLKVFWLESNDETSLFICEVPGIYCLAVHLYLAAGALEGLISSICQTFLDNAEYESGLSSRLFNPCVYEEIADIFRIFIESCYIS